jgi:gliding motility-associated-like protein
VKLIDYSSFGCSDSLTEIIVVNPNPIVNFKANDTSGCSPKCINFIDMSSIITGNYSSLWNFGDGNNSSDPNHCYTNDSIFTPLSFNITLKATSDSGCFSALIKNNYINIYPNPHANFRVQPDTTTIMNPIISFTNLSVGANFWNWDFGDMDTTSVFSPTPHTYADTGQYKITLITSTLFGCKDETYQTIFIEPDFSFYIPNSFSPNDDGTNDTFSGKGIFIKTYEMMIFDRWGNLIFFTNDINKPWDGTANYGSKIAQEDVYIYSVKLTDINKGKHNYKGIVTLVR